MGNYKTYSMSWTRTVVSLLTFALILLNILGMQAQQRKLTLVPDDLREIMWQLQGKVNYIESVSVTREDERHIKVFIQFKGYEDKAYTIKTAIVDKEKKPLKLIKGVEMDMPKTKQAEMQYLIQPLQATSKINAVHSEFLRITVSPQNAAWGALDELPGGSSLSGTEYLYELKKPWMLSGKYVQLNTKLTPYGSASTIKEN